MRPARPRATWRVRASGGTPPAPMSGPGATQGPGERLVRGLERWRRGVWDEGCSQDRNQCGKHPRWVPPRHQSAMTGAAGHAHRSSPPRSRTHAGRSRRYHGGRRSPPPPARGACARSLEVRACPGGWRGGPGSLLAKYCCDTCASEPRICGLSPCIRRIGVRHGACSRRAVPSFPRYNLDTLLSWTDQQLSRGGGCRGDMARPGVGGMQIVKAYISQPWNDIPSRFMGWMGSLICAGGKHLARR